MEAADLSAWTPPPRPEGAVLAGRFVRVEPLDPDRHGPALVAAFAAAPGLFDFLPYGPFADPAAHMDWLVAAAARPDPRFHALVLPGEGAAGLASYLRIDPAAGSVEVGHICLAPPLQRSPAATEAMALMMGHAFGLGYRRYEWKCNAANLASRRAAQRLGFSFEGVFRQAAVVKGRNRDTAWFSVIDGEWPALRAAFDAWLDPANFDPGGEQRRSLSALTRPLVATPDPAL
jgi:RimJ/RimL family protein N-acetyltransferase